jgi:hypothetical protein
VEPRKERKKERIKINDNTTCKAANIKMSKESLVVKDLVKKWGPK